MRICKKTRMEVATMITATTTATTITTKMMPTTTMMTMTMVMAKMLAKIVMVAMIGECMIWSGEWGRKNNLGPRFYFFVHKDPSKNKKGNNYGAVMKKWISNIHIINHQSSSCVLWAFIESHKWSVQRTCRYIFGDNFV